MLSFERFLLGGLLLLSACAWGQDASNFSGLKDRELKVLKGALPSDPKDPHKLDITDLLGVIRGSQKKDKNLNITRVTVLEDRRTMLRVRFEYETQKQPVKLSIWVLGKGGKPIEDISTPPISLTEASGEMEAVVRLKSRPPALAVPFSTGGLQFGVGSGTTLDTLVGGIGNGPAFLCEKKWEPVPNVITAKPYGLAATNPPSPTGGGGGARLYIRPYSMESIKAGSVVNTSTVVNSSSTYANIFKTTQGYRRRPRPGGTTPVPSGPVPPKGPGTMLVFTPKEFQSSADAMTDDLPLVFQDADPASGYYYYKPNRFALSWDAESSYAFKMIYGAAAGADGASKGVTLAARLEAPVSGLDLAMITKLITETPGMKFVALRPFPIGTPPTYNLVGSLKSYGINPENVFVTGASEQGDEMEVRIVTDALTKETLQTLMSEGLGLAGDVLFDSAKSGGGADPVKVSIPATMRFADTLSFGGRPLVRGGDNHATFKNDTPYPVKLEYANVLKISGADRIIYNYSLGPVELQPGDEVKVDLAALPGWMDTDPSIRRKWFQFSVLPDSIATESILGIATGGADQTTQSSISVSVLEWKGKTNAVALRLEVRSRYLDTKHTQVLSKDLTIKADGESAQIGPFYMPAKVSGNFYEYRLTAVDADGNEKVGKWVPSDKTTLFIGVKQIKDALGEPASSR